MANVATTWSGWGAEERSYLVIQDGFERILARFPFSMQKIRPNNGTKCASVTLLAREGQRHPFPQSLLTQERQTL